MSFATTILSLFGFKVTPPASPQSGSVPVVPIKPAIPVPSSGDPQQIGRSNYTFAPMSGNSVTGREQVFRRSGDILEADTNTTLVATGNGKFVPPSEIGAACFKCGAPIERGGEQWCDICGRCFCIPHIRAVPGPSGERQLCFPCLEYDLAHTNTWDNTPPAIPASVTKRNRTGRTGQ